MADAVDLKSNAVWREGSNPFSRTIYIFKKGENMKAFRCDRCGKFYDKDAYSKIDRVVKLPYGSNSEVKVVGISAKYPYDCTGALIDICPNCIEELKIWLSGADFIWCRFQIGDKNDQDCKF